MNHLIYIIIYFKCSFENSKGVNIFLTTVLTFLVFFGLLSYIPILNTPVEILIKKPEITKYVGCLLYTFLASRWITSKNYSKSIEKVCSLCHTDMVNNLKKYNDYLENAPESINIHIEERY